MSTTKEAVQKWPCWLLMYFSEDRSTANLLGAMNGGQAIQVLHRLFSDLVFLTKLFYMGGTALDKNLIVFRSYKPGFLAWAWTATSAVCPPKHLHARLSWTHRSMATWPSRDIQCRAICSGYSSKHPDTTITKHLLGVQEMIAVIVQPNDLACSTRL